MGIKALFLIEGQPHLTAGRSVRGGLQLGRVGSSWEADPTRRLAVNAVVTGPYVAGDRQIGKLGRSWKIRDWTRTRFEGLPAAPSARPHGRESFLSLLIFLSSRSPNFLPWAIAWQHPILSRGGS